MKVSNYGNPALNFRADTDNKNNKKDFLNKFETGIRNSADLNDTVQVPRTIFKGYMAFMVSTTLVTLASFAKDKTKFAPKAANVSAALIALWGSYSFARPYLLRNSSQGK